MLCVMGVVGVSHEGTSFEGNVRLGEDKHEDKEGRERQEGRERRDEKGRDGEVRRE